MLKLYKIMFFSSMVMGTLISLSAYTWFTAWMGLEINLLSIIPLLSNHKNKYPSESALKYFITQTMASSILLFSMIYFFSMKNSLSDFLEVTESMMMTTSLLLKMGAAPFHFWFPEVLSGLNWTNSFILLTWQKIAPLALLSYNIKINVFFISTIIITSTIVGGIQGLNQICLRKIMAYSSINHVGWLISSMLNSMNTCVIYFFIYSIINLNMIFILKKFKLFYLNQLSSIFSNSKMIKFFFMLNFLSLGGLPPFLGFLPKWLVINNLVYSNNYTLASMLIIFTLVSLYFYLRITFSSFSIMNEEYLMIMFNKMSFFHFITNLFSLLGLTICMLMDSPM